MLDLLTDPGQRMHELATRLFPVNRSIMGEGTRQSLRILQETMPDMILTEVPSGTRVNDWTVPQEWWITGAAISSLDGQVLVDFADCNLHVVGYSEPIDAVMTREELEPHLHSLPDQPDAVPYVTSYYERRWGFCLSERQRQGLGDGPFHVRIDAGHADGSLTYGEVLLPGELEDEVLLSTYVCHPSMANNELSGPVVMAALYQWLKARSKLKYSYRMFIGPETIGAIAYLDKNLELLQSRVRAGWVLTCLGDERSFSYLPSRMGGTLADRITHEVLSTRDYKTFSFLDRGSDERQWCAPCVDLPVCSVMRSKYGTYPEYHTSLDDLSLVTATGLEGGFTVLTECLECLEDRPRWTSTVKGEPQLGGRGLYSTLSTVGSAVSARPLLNVLAYCDGNHDVSELAALTQMPVPEVLEALRILRSEELVVER